MYMTPAGFDWDEGNRKKNWVKHLVSIEECEQIFVNRPLLIIDNPGHSTTEIRYAAFGKTDAGRLLFIVFTWREEMIRVISARDQDKHERRQYENANEET
jgi:uncharacterized DUF497 family protein